MSYHDLDLDVHGLATDVTIAWDKENDVKKKKILSYITQLVQLAGNLSWDLVMLEEK